MRTIINYFPESTKPTKTKSPQTKYFNIRSDGK